MAENSHKQPSGKRQRGRGRPSSFTPKLGAQICLELASGKSLRRICAKVSMPPESTVRGWVLDDVGGFSAQYTRARDIGLDARADEVLDVAEGDGSEDADIQRDRLRFDAMRWYLSKMAPKRYGDRLEVGGAVQHDHTHRLSKEQADAARRAAGVTIEGKAVLGKD